MPGEPRDHEERSPHAPVHLALCRVWGALPEDVPGDTDWWWVIYPSHVSEQWPDFERTEFITGGMGRGPNGGPLFIADFVLMHARDADGDYIPGRLSGFFFGGELYVRAP